MFLLIGSAEIIACGLFVVILYTMAISFLVKTKAEIISYALLLIPIIGPLGIVIGAFRKMMKDIESKTKEK